MMGMNVMNRRRVCMLVLNEVSSDPRVTKEANSLKDQYDISIIGIRKSLDISIDEELNGYRILRVNHIKKIRNSKQLNVFSLILLIFSKVIAMIKIARVAYREKADIYHAHDFEMLPIAYFVSKLRRSKLIYDSHELWVEQRADFPRWFKKTIRIVEGFLIRRTDLIITVNHSIAQELKERYQLPVTPTVLRNLTPYQELSKEKFHSMSDKQPIIVLYHGGYNVDRGLEELIQSVEYLRPKVILRLRGMGPLEDQLKKLADSFIKEGRVEFCDPVPMHELVMEAQESHIGVIPYKPTCLNNYYSLPNKLSEYLMAGLAVCASDLPEIRYLNDEVQFGELFDPYDPKSIAMSINRLVEQMDALTQYKERARSWAENEGNWEKEQRVLLEGYQTVLGENYEKETSVDHQSI